MADHLQRHVDPFRCSCGPCKKFWHSVFKNSNDTMTFLSEQRAESSSTFGNHKPIAIGDRVKVNGNAGVVKFVGFVDDNTIAPTLRVGVKLDESVLMGHDGVYNGKRYFHCTNGHGVFVKYTEITPARPPSQRPPLQGNTMFPSWPEICKRRRQREIMLQEMHKERQRTKTQGIPAKTFPPPLISPRETRANKLRKEAMRPFQSPHDDPYIGRKKHVEHTERLLPGRMSESSQTRWQDKQILQWHRKYADEEKAKRMGDTLIKLTKAYQEGLLEGTSPEPELE